MSSNSYLQTCGENGLPVRRGNGAFVFNVRPDERDTSADMLRSRGAVDDCALLNDDITQLSTQCIGRGWWRECGCSICARVERQRGKQELRIRVVQQAARDQVVIDRQR